MKQGKHDKDCFNDPMLDPATPPAAPCACGCHSYPYKGKRPECFCCPAGHAPAAPRPPSAPACSVNGCACAYAHADGVACNKCGHYAAASSESHDMTPVHGPDCIDDCDECACWCHGKRGSGRVTAARHDCKTHPGPACQPGTSYPTAPPPAAPSLEIEADDFDRALHEAAFPASMRTLANDTAPSDAEKWGSHAEDCALRFYDYKCSCPIFRGGPPYESRAAARYRELLEEARELVGRVIEQISGGEDPNACEYCCHALADPSHDCDKTKLAALLARLSNTIRKENP